jgi:Protein of unknown function (DUF3574)
MPDMPWSKVLPLPATFCLLLASCASVKSSAPAAATCGSIAGSALWARTELYFGMQKPDGSMTSEEDYRRFLDDVISPRLRAGFTVLDGNGQYLDSTDRLWREPTKVLIVTYPPDPATSASLEEIRRTYKATFQQQSVMRVDSNTCVGF